MDYSIVIPVIISFAISVVLSPVVIPFLRKLKIGQTEREEGVKAHQKKNGTPTMGGLMILTSVVITSLLYVKDYPNIIPILFATLGFGIIGFLDDYIKVVMRRSEGLTPWQKMLGQILITGIFAYYVINYTDVEMTMLVPFTDLKLDFGILTVPVMFFVMIGTVNGVNFTDGSGWACFQRYCIGCNLFFRSSHRNEKRNRTDYLCGSRKPFGIFIV